MQQTTQLLVIDPQNDFCDLPVREGQKPALPVAGAHADMQRLARWIDRQSAHLDNITITLDSHQAYDIAHPTFWQERGGAAVPPFTTISSTQVYAGDYAPRNPAAMARALAYLDALEAQGRYQLMVWPLHCEIGSWGHGVHADVLAAARRWQEQHQRAVHHVFKGMNPWTEHYSAVRAEVPDPLDVDTGTNQALLARLHESTRLVIAGEASSHCVRATTEHIVEHWTSDFSRIVLLTDCMSPVASFETEQDAFFARMRKLGVRCENSAAVDL